MIPFRATSFRRELFRNPAMVRNAVPGSLLFFLFFQFTKHDPRISAILPFGDDPYDAVASFGVVIAGLLALLSIARAVQVSTTRCQVLVARTQAAVSTGVLVTLAAYAVAMAWHLPMWFGRPAAAVALMVVMLALALLLSILARLSVHDRPGVPMPWKRAAVVCVIAVVLLAVYPESLTASTVRALHDSSRHPAAVRSRVGPARSPRSLAPQPCRIRQRSRARSSPLNAIGRNRAAGHRRRCRAAGGRVDRGRCPGTRAEGDARVGVRRRRAGRLVDCYYCLRRPLALFRY